jgi:hypothetical protein
MATQTYINGRRKYARPQAMLWANNSGTLTNGFYVPNGYEINSDTTGISDQSLLDQFLILSDDNRGEINFNNNRIEKRERMINGRMRSYHIADKLTISTSWNMLPSRSHGLNPSFNSSGKTSLINEGLREPGTDASFSQLPNVTIQNQEYTTDGGAGGVDLVDWYDSHKGSFWVYLAYDKYSNFGKDNLAYAHLGQYNELIEMFVSDFSYTVVKRGGSNYDFWNVSCTLEEV